MFIRFISGVGLLRFRVARVGFNSGASLVYSFLVCSICEGLVYFDLVWFVLGCWIYGLYGEIGGC